MGNEYHEEHGPKKYTTGQRIGRILEFLLTMFIVLPIRILIILISHIHAIFLLSVIGAVGVFIYIIVQIRSTIP